MRVRLIMHHSVTTFQEEINALVEQGFEPMAPAVYYESSNLFMITLIKKDDKPSVTIKES